MAVAVVAVVAVVVAGVAGVVSKLLFVPMYHIVRFQIRYLGTYIFINYLRRPLGALFSFEIYLGTYV